MSIEYASASAAPHMPGVRLCNADTGMDYMKARAMVAQLLDHDQEKAQDILARCCENKTIHDEIFFCLSKLGVSTHQSPPVGRGSFGSSVSPSLHESHHSGSHIPQHEIPLRQLSEYPPTPARTARSEVSHSTKGDTSDKEYIYLLNPAEDKVEEQLVRMRIAPIAHSVIRDDLVSTDELDANTVSIEEGEVHIPLDADTGTTTIVPYRCVVKLTWCRRKSGRTHRTTFYVVSEKFLDDDIIMGHADARVEYSPADVPPLNSHESTHFQGYSPGLRPSGRTPPASYHRSAETNNDSLPAHYQTRHNNQHLHIPVIPEAIYSAPAAPGVLMENHHHPQHMSLSNRFPGSQPTQHEISQPNPYRATVTTNASTNSVSETQADVRAEKLRVAIKWDETYFNVWLYPDAPSQTFFEAFQSQVGKRKKLLDRTVTSILLKEDEEASDEKSYELFLDEDSLDADWKAIVKWLQKNKKNESPHIFGRVHVETGEVG